MATNKRIKTTESLQKRFFNGSKNLVIEIEKLMLHQSATKKGIIFEMTIFLEVLFAGYRKKVLFFSFEGRKSLGRARAGYLGQAGLRLLFFC